MIGNDQRDVGYCTEKRIPRQRRIEECYRTKCHPGSGDQRYRQSFAMQKAPRAEEKRTDQIGGGPCTTRRNELTDCSFIIRKRDEHGYRDEIEFPAIPTQPCDGYGRKDRVTPNLYW